MSAIYRKKSTVDLYVISGGDLGRIVNAAGERQLTLSRPHSIVDARTGEPVALQLGSEEQMHQVLVDNWAHDLVVSKAEFEEGFEKVPGIRDRGNSPIEELLAQYEAEYCDHSKVEWLIQAAYRYSQTMEDCQVRCLLYAMARHLDGKPLPPPVPDEPQ